VLQGPLPDQAALAAFLARLENFGANVIEIRRFRERRGQSGGQSGGRSDARARYGG
jgi:hypothetical protein